jgi:Xaa-Pro aminopeptidase
MVNGFLRAWAGLALLAAINLSTLSAASQDTTKQSSTTSLSPAVPLQELMQRRDAALTKFHDGILLLHSGSGMKRWEDYGFRQGASFYYLTGMANLHDSILVLDGPKHEIILFVRVLSPAPFFKEAMSMFSGLNQFALAPGAASANLAGVTRVENWDGFSAWLDGRLKDDPALPLYFDNGGQVGDFAGYNSNPDDMPPIENVYLLWPRSLKARWPSATFKPGYTGLNEIRAVKSDYEQALLRHAAVITGAGIDAAVHGLQPGRTHRQVEGEVIAAMMDAGAEGPGFWPWVKSGSSAHLPGLFVSFFDYHALNHVMADGEIARVNLGGEYGMYKGDYGRSFPVGAKFTPDQREVLDLFSHAYLAGLQVIRPGENRADVVNASMADIKDHRSALKSDLARAAADVLVTARPWSMYAHGIDMVEDVPAVFAAGNVLCWAPEFSVDDEGFYMQDTVLVTASGHDLLNPPLPYEPQALEALKAKLSGTGLPGPQ